MPDVVEKTICYKGSDNIMRKRYEYQTPVGTLSSQFKELPDHPLIQGQLIPWHEEYVFKSPEDYAPILFCIRNRRYIPNYEMVTNVQEDTSGDIIFFPLGRLFPPARDHHQYYGH